MSAGLESWAPFRLELALCAWLIPLHFYRIKFNHKKSFLSFKNQVRMMELKHAFQPIDTRIWCDLCQEATGSLISWVCKVHFQPPLTHPVVLSHEEAFFLCVEEMALSLTCLPCKLENLSSDHEHPCKKAQHGCV